MTFEGAPDGSIKLVDFTHKIKFEQEICSPDRLYPDHFNCASRCSQSSHLKKNSITEFLSFAFYKTEAHFDSESKTLSFKSIKFKKKLFNIQIISY